jgi:hypothetical protein
MERVTEGVGRITEGMGRVVEGIGRVMEGMGTVTEGMGRVTEGVGRVVEAATCQFPLLLNVQNISSPHPRGSVLWEKQACSELCH